MMLEISTPALLFPTISLILLAYTNRFLGLASIVRKLHDDYEESPQSKYLEQIENLRRRIYLIRDMQLLGVGSLFCCTLCITFLCIGWEYLAIVAFAASLLLMLGSLALSIVEIRISVNALEVHLKTMEEPTPKKNQSIGVPTEEAIKVPGHAEPIEMKRPKRAFFRFSVSSLLWMSLLVAVVMLWQRDIHKIRREMLLSGYSMIGQSQSWSIDQVIGEPNTTAFGDIPTAWASQSPDGGMEWIIVEFPKSVEASGVDIYETNSPGAVVSISTVSMYGQEIEIWKGTDPLAGSRAGGIASISFSPAVETRRLKIVLDSNKYPGYNEIDAVKLKDKAGGSQWASQAWASSSFGTHRPAPSWYWP